MIELNLDVLQIDHSTNNLTDEGFLKIWLGVSDTNRPLVYAKDDGIQVEIIEDDELFKQESLNTIVGKSVCVGHPETPITAKNHNKYEVGSILQESRNNNGVLEVAAIIKDEDTISKIKNKELVYTSLGYHADKDAIAGKKNYIKQSNRRYNHCSLLTKNEIPRAGLSSRIITIDKLDDIINTPNDIENKSEMDTLKDLIGKLKALQLDNLTEAEYADLKEIVDTCQLSSRVIEKKPKTEETQDTKHNPKAQPDPVNLPDKSPELAAAGNIDQNDLVTQIAERTGNEIATRVELLTKYGGLLTSSGYNTDSMTIKEEILKSQLGASTKFTTPEQINGAFTAWEAMHTQQQTHSLNNDAKYTSSSHNNELIGSGLVVDDEARKKYIENLNKVL